MKERVIITASTLRKTLYNFALNLIVNSEDNIDEIGKIIMIKIENLCHGINFAFMLFPNIEQMAIKTISNKETFTLYVLLRKNM